MLNSGLQPIALRTDVSTNSIRLDWFCGFLMIFVIATRMYTAGEAYFQDGIKHIQNITDGILVIQVPGYWLFNAFVSNFSDYANTIEVINLIFSVFGAIIFYQVALLLAQTTLARLSTLAYVSIFYVWFAGNIHSTYASQIMFPIAVFWMVLLHAKTGSFSYIFLACILFSLGAGFRPSDGFLMLPFLMFYCFNHLRFRELVYCFFITSVVCLAWLIPTELEYRKIGESLLDMLGYTSKLTQEISPLKAGFSYRSMANVARVVLPFVAAFWLILPLIFLISLRKLDETNNLLILWIVPGLLFFLLYYMGPAPYLNFLTAAVILLALNNAAKLRSDRIARILFAACFVWNVSVFLVFVPIPGTSVLTQAVNVYVGTYTKYGIQNKQRANLSKVVDPDKPF